MSEQVSQSQIETLLALREQAGESKAAAAKKQAELDAEEKRLMKALEAGTAVEPGAYFLVTVTEETGRSVGWRGIVERELGKGFAETELAKTEPGERAVLKIFREVDGR